jgi:hypothetical protein
MASGKWEVSTVTDKDIRELKDAGYIPANIFHRAAEEGQAIPTPKQGERVVFVPHFIRGLSFPLHPFVRGLMFFYGLDFHDLPPNSFMHISAFIIVCEAFLRVEPHFGLWLKIFNIKPKCVAGAHADCGGAVIGKLPRAVWPSGTFIDTIKTWQKEWFYITEPKEEEGGTVPAECGTVPAEFRSGPPTRLTSWVRKGLDWGSATEVEDLQRGIASLIREGVGLTNVVQVMLRRHILPCQRRSSPMWDYRTDDDPTVRRLFRTTREKLWKALLKAQKDWPGKKEDKGLSAAKPPSEVCHDFNRSVLFFRR